MPRRKQKPDRCLPHCHAADQMKLPISTKTRRVWGCRKCKQKYVVTGQWTELESVDLGPITAPRPYRKGASRGA